MAKNNKITKEQLETIEQCVCFINPDMRKRIVYDVVDKGAITKTVEIGDDEYNDIDRFGVVKSFKKDLEKD